MVCSILICMLHCSGALHKINKISQKANWKGQPDRWTGPGIDKGDTLTKEIIANLIVNLWGGGIGQLRLKIVISPQQIVRLTSNKAVN